MASAWGSALTSLSQSLPKFGASISENEADKRRRELEDLQKQSAMIGLSRLRREDEQGAYEQEQRTTTAKNLAEYERNMAEMGNVPQMMEAGPMPPDQYKRAEELTSFKEMSPLGRLQSKSLISGSAYSPEAKAVVDTELEQQEYTQRAEDKRMAAEDAASLKRELKQADIDAKKDLEKQRAEDRALLLKMNQEFAKTMKEGDPDKKRSEDFNQEQKLRQQFIGTTKDFRSVRDAYNRVQASAKNPSAAGDMALIFNYMKILDPGSTVREGEFATAQNSGSVPTKISNMYNRAINGKRLDDIQRSDFLDRSKSLFNAQTKTYEAAKNQYTNIAKAYDLNPENVVSGFDNPPTGEMASPTTEEEYNALPSGTTYIDPDDGKKYRKP